VSAEHEPEASVHMRTCLTLPLLSAVVLATQMLHGEIRYDPDRNRISILGYPEERPATLSDVFDADRKGGWRKVVYDTATDTWTVRADLWVGADRGFGTFLQIGRAQHPTETLVLYGNLVVCAPAKSGQRADGRYRISSRLTLGDESNPRIQATLKIACSRKGEFGVDVMAPVPKAKQERQDLPAGEWFMFNSVLTAATPDRDHTFKAAIRLSHSGINYRLSNSTVSWWNGALFPTVYLHTRRWMPDAERTAQGMVFEHGGDASGPFPCSDCVFRDLAVGRTNAGAMRCLFEDNRANVQLTPYHVGAVFTDCVLGDCVQPLRVPRSGRNEQWLRNYSVHRDASDLKLVLNPGLIDRVSVLVAVTDTRGKPIPRAVVTIECPEDTEKLAVVRALAVTDEDGLTPADAEGRALAITRRELRPTDDPLQPQVVKYRYRLQVTAPGYRGRQLTIEPDDALPRPLPITLHRAE